MDPLDSVSCAMFLLTPYTPINYSADIMRNGRSNFELLKLTFGDVDFQHSNHTPDDAVHIQISLEKRKGHTAKVQKGETLDEALSGKHSPSSSFHCLSSPVLIRGITNLCRTSIQHL